MGVVVRPGVTLLFVTLDKTAMQAEHRYEDAFLSAEEFRWQSQNRTKRESEAGVLLRDHVARGQHIHLFVRHMGKERGVTQPFVYAGELDFERWEGDSPITVWWRLRSPVPAELQARLKVPR